MTTAPTSSDDRTARARIRDAAIDLVAADGASVLTARKVADAAGVSPGLVIHHFGSMDGLRSACDGHVVVIIREAKNEAMAAGPGGFNLLGALRDPKYTPIIRYLAKVLSEDSSAVGDLVDEIVSDAEGYLQLGADSGVMRRTDNPRGVAAVLSMWQLGALVMHGHIKRIFGVDPTDIGSELNPAMAGYLAPGYELLSEGILTEEAAAALQSAVAALADAPPVSNKSTQNEGT